MNDGYKYKNGKVIVSEYNADNANVREEKEREYQDNIEEILIAENMIEYFKELRKEVKEDLNNKNEWIRIKKLSLYFRILATLVANLYIGNILADVLNLLNLENISYLSYIISSCGSLAFCKYKIVKPLKTDIKSYQDDANILEFTVKTINDEIEKQKELVKKLNRDKRKDNEQSLAYDSQYKWTSDYIRLDYVDQIDNIEENIWGLVDVEEERIKQEQSSKVLTKKMVKSKK